MRTYSSMSRELLSALRITHVLKHNDGLESGYTTLSQDLHEHYAEPFRIEANLGRLRFLQLGSTLAPIKEPKVR